MTEEKIRVKYVGDLLKVFLRRNPIDDDVGHGYFNPEKIVAELNWNEAVDLYLNVKHEVENKLFKYAKGLLDGRKKSGG